MAGGDKKLDAAPRVAREPFLQLVRQLVQAYQAFERFDTARLRARGLTSAQGDVLFTLGNTPGMTFKELGERTLITKGTLTGVVDRMESRRIVRREASDSDRRCMKVVLTARGDAIFRKEFPAHIEYLRERFRKLGDGEIKQLTKGLARLAGIF